MTDDEQELKEANDRELIVYGQIFYGMLGYDWFKQLIETRFDIIKNVDEEAKIIDLRVIEVPMEETLKRVRQLEEEGTPIVQPASPTEVVAFNKKK